MGQDSGDPLVGRETVYWIDCSVCGPDDGATPPTFASETELWAALLRPDKNCWVRRDDGRVLCPLHRRVAACEELGHALLPWTEHPLDDELQWRFCRRCGSEFEQRSAR